MMPGKKSLSWTVKVKNRVKWMSNKIHRLPLNVLTHPCLHFQRKDVEEERYVFVFMGVDKSPHAGLQTPRTWFSLRLINMVDYLMGHHEDTTTRK
jgi:hypothetical protein